MLTVKQGSKEWHQQRLGKITASRFKDVMTEPKTKAAKEAGELSKKATSYLYELVGELLTGQPKDVPVSRAMQWGIDHENEAVQIFSELYGYVCNEVGFVPMDGYAIGASPDRLIGEDGGVEVKCPNTEQHVRWMVEDRLPEEHFWQVHGCMFVTGRQWWKFVTYDPRVEDLENAIHSVHVERDGLVCEELEEKLFAFEKKLKETMERLVAKTI